ncbi:MAG: hypothetical protein ACQES0_07140 [Bacteroidota bacterium]
MKNRIVFIVLLIGASFVAKAQTELKLIDGEMLKIKDYRIDTSASMFYYKLQLPSGKLKVKYEILDDVFSVTDSTGDETVLYEPHGEDDLNVEQMRHYISGYAAATNQYNPLWSMAGGFAVGTGAMFVSKNPIFSPLIPVAYVGSISLVKPDRNRIIFENPDYADDEDFLYGYQRSARNKNIKYAIIGSAEGVIVGALLGMLTNYYN